MMRSKHYWLIMLLAGVLSGCSHDPRFFSDSKTKFTSAPVTMAREVTASEKLLQLQWNKVFSALAKQQLLAQEQLLSEVRGNDVLPDAEKDLQRALLLALGDADIKDVALAVNLASKYRTTQVELSPQARFAITIVNNKQDDILRFEALNAKLDALKNIEESMIRRGQ